MGTPPTVVIDYGAGNLRSVVNALHAIGENACVVGRGADWPQQVGRVILPGVGSFGDAMAELHQRDLVAPLREAIATQVPYLGICLGYQLLFDASEESPGVVGLGVVPGVVRRFAAGKKVPHMGWNAAELTQREHAYWQGAEAAPYYYFVHSFYPVPDDVSWVAAHTDYEEVFASAITRGSLLAVQFHPEKSQEAGLELLERFLQHSQSD